jgi:hypothetical protein
VTRTVSPENAAFYPLRSLTDTDVDIIVEFGLHDRDEIMAQNRDDFRVTMLEMHQANSSRKWRLMMKNAKMKKQD